MVPRSGAGAGVPEGVVADGPRLAQAATKEQSRIVGKVRFTNFNYTCFAVVSEQENPTWGYTRLRGAVKNLGHELGRNTIKNSGLDMNSDATLSRGLCLLFIHPRAPNLTSLRSAGTMPGSRGQNTHAAFRPSMSASILETCKLLTRWAFEYFDQTRFVVGTDVAEAAVAALPDPS